MVLTREEVETHIQTLLLYYIPNEGVARLEALLAHDAALRAECEHLDYKYHETVKAFSDEHDKLRAMNTELLEALNTTGEEGNMKKTDKDIQVAALIVQALERQIDTPFKSQEAREVAISVVSFYIEQYVGSVRRTNHDEP